jgi:hypothetical protein
VPLTCLLDSQGASEPAVRMPPDLHQQGMGTSVFLPGYSRMRRFA